MKAAPALMLVMVTVIMASAIMVLGYSIESFLPVNETFIQTSINGILGASVSNPYLGQVYVLYSPYGNLSGGFVIVGSGMQLSVVTLPNCTSPYMASIGLNGKVIYVSCPSTNLIYEVNATTGALLGYVHVDYAPTWLYYDSGMGTLLIVASGSGKLAIYNPLNSSIRYFEVASTISDLWPLKMALANSGGDIIYLIYGTGYVLYVNYTTLQVANGYCGRCPIVNLGSTPLYAYYDAENNILFVSTYTGIYALDGSTGSILFRINVSAIWLASDGKLLYALSGGEVYVFRYIRDWYFEVGIVHLPAPASSISLLGADVYAPIPQLYMVDELSPFKSPNGLYPVYIYVNTTGYNITITGTVNISLTDLSYNTTLMLPNGIYNATIQLPSELYVSEKSMMFAVNDSTIKIIAYTYKSYKITFIENGLANNFTWGVWLYGLTASGSMVNITQEAPAGMPIVIYLEPGVYRFTILPIFGYSASPSMGIVDVAQAGEGFIYVNFSLIQYLVNMVFENAPMGSIIVARLSGVTIGGFYVNRTLTAIVPQYTLSLPDGVYRVDVVNVIYGQYVGVATMALDPIEFTVWGMGVNVTIPLAVNEYPINIALANLPPGVSWSITIAGTMFNGTRISRAVSSTYPNSTIKLMLPDGSYTVSLSMTSMNGYANPYVASEVGVVVNGHGVNTTLTLTAASYTLVIRVNRILGISPYTVNIIGVLFNGQPYRLSLSSTSPIEVLSLPDGYYIVSVGGGLYITSASRQIRISGFPPPPISVTLIGVLLVIIIAVAAAAILIYVLWSRGYIFTGG